jgi:hypothetical protein
MNQLPSRGHKYFVFNKKLGIATGIRAWTEEEALNKLNWSKKDCNIEMSSQSYRPKPKEES